MPAQSLELGDLDGDGRKDLLALGSSNGSSLAYPRILFFDKNGKPTDVIDPRILISSPLLIELEPSADPSHRSQQIAFTSEYGIGAAEFTSDRNVLPIPYPIQVLPEGWSYRVMRLGHVKQTLLNEVVLLFMSGDSNDTEGPGEIAEASTVTRLTGLPKPVDELIGPPIAANIVDTKSPCDEAVFAYRGDSRVYVFEPCDANGGLTDKNSPGKAAILPEPNTVGQTPIAALVNQEDTTLDLLIADTSAKPYVAFGRGDGLFAADLKNFDATLGKAWPVSVDRRKECPEVDTTFPLAVADLNGDGLSDWVTHKGVQLTESVHIDAALQQVQITACIYETPFDRQWSIAAVADVNGDGRLDVIAGSDAGADLDLWRGTGLSVLNQSVIITGGPVHHLATGDFDGDGVRDIVFDALKAVHDPDDSAHNTLSIAFGRVAQPPETAVDIGNFARIDQVETAKYEGLDSMDEIGVIATPSDSPGQQLSVFIGSSGRRPIAPMGLQAPGPLPGEMIEGYPLTLAGGNLLGGDLPSLLAESVVCHRDCGECQVDCVDCRVGCVNRLWLVPTASAGKFSVPMPSVSLPDSFVGFRYDEQTPSVRLVIGDVDGVGNDDALALTTDVTGSYVYMWRVTLPTQSGGWTQDPPVEVLSITPGKLTPASNPKLIDIVGDKGMDLVMIVGDANGRQRLGVVSNQNGTLDMARITYIDIPEASGVRAYAIAEVQGSPQLFVVADAATYAVGRVKTDAGWTLNAPEVIPDVPGGISIAVGNLAGYGLMDFAISDSQGLQLYAAERK
jgi:hypothetical protein